MLRDLLPMLASFCNANTTIIIFTPVPHLPTFDLRNAEFPKWLVLSDTNSFAEKYHTSIPLPFVKTAARWICIDSDFIKPKHFSMDFFCSIESHLPSWSTDNGKGADTFFEELLLGLRLFCWLCLLVRYDVLTTQLHLWISRFTFGPLFVKYVHRCQIVCAQYLWIEIFQPKGQSPSTSEVKATNLFSTTHRQNQVRPFITFSQGYISVIWYKEERAYNIDSNSSL